MPSKRTYKVSPEIKLAYFKVSKSRITDTIFNKPNSQHITNITSDDTQSNIYTAFQNYILEIIQFIIDKVSLDTIIASLETYRKEINSHAEAEAALDNIKILIVSVIDNISAGVNMTIVIDRITYIQGLLKVSGDKAIYGEIFEMIIEIIDEITNRKPLDDILSNLKKYQPLINVEGDAANNIITIQLQIISIIENIIAGISMNIILDRISYVKGLVINIIATNIF
jgi:hypothetical protein